MRVAIDATYSVDAHPSGIAIYSTQLMAHLAAQFPADRFLHCYRAKQWRQAPSPARSNVRKKILLPPLPTFSADVYHALNQRVDARPAKCVVSTFHDLFVITGEYSTPEFRRRFAEQARGAAERSDLIIAVSEFTAAQVVSLLGVERSRIRVIGHGVHRPDAVPPQEPRENLVLFVGALQSRKNVSRLVAAMEAMPADWKLALAGAPSGFRATEILSEIEQSPIRERISVTGYVSASELEQLYRRASIFAFPSLDEGFGMPVLEAMARGVPVLTSNGSALAEVAGQAALLVNPLDRAEIADGLVRLARDPELRRDLTRKGECRTAEFSWGRAAAETHAVYAELATGSTSYF